MILLVGLGEVSQISRRFFDLESFIALSLGFLEVLLRDLRATLGLAIMRRARSAYNVILWRRVLIGATDIG